ncbi:type II toxin-antitoxin system HicB family antitoxin [Kluyvera sichuanensis]|uniref:Type II toxin-antitoxin system HicB family antitoxin n=1 Tax=Kluyvera sichuanensis TaxID=2725494 RepID=A0ABR6RQH0_9ENTR|nr:type II toxin-antitoxin system HicB family antitoxin [Kluyvera sichuanensis]MBC1185368.1 type II toxin-antitoxin system HicB family antitoxin [Kluyvera sichuanensis]
MHTSTLFIDGHKARVKYDPIIEMFRGEFLNTDRRATFIAGDAKELTIAARDAFDCYCNNCRATGVKPFDKKKRLPGISSLLSRIIH